MPQTFEFLKNWSLVWHKDLFLMTFQVLPVSGWVGNAIRISCLELGNGEGMGNKNEFRRQSKINQWRIYT